MLVKGKDDHVVSNKFPLSSSNYITMLNLLNQSMLPLIIDILTKTITMNFKNYIKDFKHHTHTHLLLTNHNLINYTNDDSTLKHKWFKPA